MATVRIFLTFQHDPNYVLVFGIAGIKISGPVRSVKNFWSKKKIKRNQSNKYWTRTNTAWRNMSRWRVSCSRLLSEKSSDHPTTMTPCRESWNYSFNLVSQSPYGKKYVVVPPYLLINSQQLVVPSSNLMNVSKPTD